MLPKDVIPFDFCLTDLISFVWNPIYDMDGITAIRISIDDIVRSASLESDGDVSMAPAILPTSPWMCRLPVEEAVAKIVS